MICPICCGSGKKPTGEETNFITEKGDPVPFGGLCGEKDCYFCEGTGQVAKIPRLLGEKEKP